jgi:hypothetical protein
LKLPHILYYIFSHIFYVFFTTFGF